MKLITASFNFSVALMTLVFFSVIIVPVSGQQSTSLQEPQILLDKANSLLQQRNFSGARIAFQRYLAQYSNISSDNSEAVYGLAYAALQAKHKDGEVLMQSFISNHQNNVRRNSATFYLAQHFYQNQKYSKAITAFSNVEFQSLTYSQQVEGKFQLGYSNFTERKLEEALLNFNQIKFTEHAYSAASSYYAGFIEFDKSLYDQALIDLKKAESNEAYASIVPYLIASVYYRKGAYAELLAYAEAKKSVDNLKNRNELILLIAEASYSLGDFAKAAESYAVALKDTKLGDAAIWYRAGMSLDQIGNKKDAINMLELAATTATPVAFIASYQLGILYLQQGEKGFAVNAFNRARKSDDTTVAEQAQFTYAKVLYDQGQSEKAIVEFERYLEIYPKAPSANATKELLAQAYINGNNYQKAIEYIESLSVKSPVIEQAYQKASFLKGSEFYNKERYSEAVTFFKKSLSYPRDESFIQRASFWCAEAFAILRNYSEAEQMYKQCIQIQTMDQSIYLQAQYGLSYVLYNHKKFEEALDGFKIVVSKSSKQAANYTDAQLRLADCYYTTRDFGQALIFYTQYIKSGGLDRDYAYLQSGMVYGIQRNYTESKNQFTLLINSFPKSTYRAEAFYQRAQFNIEQGDYVSAINGLTSLLQAGIGSPFIPYAYARRAASFYNTKDFDKTVQDYLSLIRSYPTHPLSQEVLLPLQEALDRVGRSAEFPSYLSMVKKANPDTKGLESLEFETAKKMYFNEQYASAIEAFTSFKSNYPQSTLLLEATFYQAESYYRLRNWDKASTLYDELKKATTFPFASRVASRLADVNFKKGNFQEAIQSYQYFKRFASSKKDWYTSFSGLMESYFLLSQYDSSDYYARQIIEVAAINAGAENKASLFIGKSAMARGDFDSAEDEFLNTLNAARDEFGAEAKYLLGSIFYMRKDYKQCYETLISLNTDFSTYEYWVGKSYLLLSDNYLSQNQLFQAKATLQSLVDNFPLETIKNEAKNKLEALNEQQTRIASQDSLIVKDK